MPKTLVVDVEGSVSELQGAFANHVSSHLPDGLAARIRWLFAALAVLVAPLSAVDLAVEGLAWWPDGVVATVALVAVCVWAWRLYVCDGLPLWAEPVGPLGIYFAGVALGSPDEVFALMEVLVFGRMLYAGRKRAWLSVAGFIIAWEGIDFTLRGLPAALDVSFLATTAAIVVSATVMGLVGEVIRAQERSMRRDQLLGDAASELQRASSHHDVYGVAGSIGLALCEEVEGAVGVWRGDPQTVWVDHRVGAVADDTPQEVALKDLPTEIRRALLMGRIVQLGEEDAARMQQAAAMKATYSAMVIAPFLKGEDFAGALIVASRTTLPHGLVRALQRLAADIGLALDRADSTVLLQRIAESSSDAILVLSRDLRVAFASPTASGLLGRQREAIADASLTELLAMSHDEVGSLLERAADADDTDCAVVTLAADGGDARAIEVAAARVRGEDDGWVVNLRDITARKLHEDVLASALRKERELTEELRQVDAMRTTFIQAVSHELRTPLTAITGYSKTLLRNSDRLDEELRSTLLERLDHNADKLSRLLGDLLDVDRLSSHEVAPNRRRVNVLSLVTRVVEQLDQSTHHVSCIGEAVEADLDAPKVERIVENLVRNAIKHTEPGTTVSVEVAADPVGDGVVLSVGDDGGGIPEQLLPSIFEPFVQGPQSATAASPGMGLGLSLVARFAELHGGRTRAANLPDGGAVFQVWLPGSPRDGGARQGIASLSLTSVS